MGNEAALNDHQNIMVCFNSNSYRTKCGPSRLYTIPLTDSLLLVEEGEVPFAADDLTNTVFCDAVTEYTCDSRTNDQTEDTDGAHAQYQHMLRKN